MRLNTIRFGSVLLTSISMAAGFAHLLELPAKMKLARDDYLLVQQIYRGWALLGIAVVGALVFTAVLTYLERGSARAFYLSLMATLSIALSLVLFFIFTYPANQATRNWTVLPDDWVVLRLQWEYSHAAGALLYLTALVSLTLSLLTGPH